MICTNIIKCLSERFHYNNYIDKTKQHITCVNCSAAGFAQNEGEQSRSVGRLVENRNKMIITTCQNNSRRLLCELQANSLIIDSENQLYLRNIEILINTCISALTPVFTFSNRMMDNRTNLRKSTTIPLGQLSIMFDLDVCVNKTTDITMISTAVSWSHYWRVICDLNN